MIVAPILRKPAANERRIAQVRSSRVELSERPSGMADTIKAILVPAGDRVADVLRGTQASFHVEEHPDEEEADQRGGDLRHVE
jgi:hypothetical protein